MTITSITYEAFHEALGPDAGRHPAGRSASEETQALYSLAVGEAITIETDHHHTAPPAGGPVYTSRICTLYNRLHVAARRQRIKIICRCKDHTVYVLRTA